MNSKIIKRLLPLMDRILVKKSDPVKQTKGGIVIPEKSQQPVMIAKVLAVGPGQRNENGVYMKPTVNVGDEVLLPKYGGTRVSMDDDSELHLYKETDILAKVE